MRTCGLSKPSKIHMTSAHVYTRKQVHNNIDEKQFAHYMHVQPTRERERCVCVCHDHSLLTSENQLTTTTTTPAKWPLFQDNLGKPVPER